MKTIFVNFIYSFETLLYNNREAVISMTMGRGWLNYSSFMGGRLHQNPKVANLQCPLSFLPTCSCLKHKKNTMAPSINLQGWKISMFPFYLRKMFHPRGFYRDTLIGHPSEVTIYWVTMESILKTAYVKMLNFIVTWISKPLTQRFVWEISNSFYYLNANVCT